jgi:hypothetical protein
MYVLPHSIQTDKKGKVCLKMSNLVKSFHQAKHICELDQFCSILNSTNHVLLMQYLGNMNLNPVMEHISVQGLECRNDE